MEILLRFRLLVFVAELQPRLLQVVNQILIALGHRNQMKLRLSRRCEVHRRLPVLDVLQLVALLRSHVLVEPFLELVLYLVQVLQLYMVHVHFDHMVIRTAIQVHLVARRRLVLEHYLV